MCIEHKDHHSCMYVMSNALYNSKRWEISDFVVVVNFKASSIVGA